MGRLRISAAVLAAGVFWPRPAPAEQATTPAGKAGACVSLNAPPTRSPMRAVWRSESRVIAVGAKGAIVRSSDGGASWNVVASGTDVDLDRIVPVGDTDLYALGKDGGAVSRDGGSSFAALQLGEQREITAFDAPAGNDVRVALCGRPIADGPRPAWRPIHGVIVRSTDHGRTFIPEAGTYDDCWLSIVSLGPAGTFAIGAGDSIARYNGSGSWEVENEPPIMDGHAEVALTRLGADDKGIFAVGEYHTRLRIAGHSTTIVVLRRTLRDGRARWAISKEPAPRSPPPAAPPRQPECCTHGYHLDASSFVSSWERAPGDIIGVGADFGRSLDGGRTWSVRSTGAQFVGIAHHGEHAVAVSQMGLLFRTDDGGRTWRTWAYGTPPDTWRFAWGMSADELFLVPSLHYSQLQHTSDGGRTWQTELLPKAGTVLQAMSGLPSRDGAALFAGGYGDDQHQARAAVLQKLPGQAEFGVHYYAIPNPPGGAAFGVTGVWATSGQAGALEAWACDTAGNVAHSEDGGLHWAVIPVAPGRLTGIAGMGPGEVYAVGDGGAFVRIRSRGAVIENRPTGVRARLNAISVSAGAIYVVSQAGDVLRSRNRGETFERLFNAETPLNAISGDDRDGVWIVGNGAILRCR